MKPLPTEASDTWSRPAPAATGPDRAPMSMVRPPGKRRGPGSMGIGEDAIAAVVRSAYDIVDAQIERGKAAARSLRAASVSNGLGEPNEVLGRTERLAQDTLLLLVEWSQALSARPTSPLKRLMAAEFSMLESLFGLPTRPVGEAVDKPAAGANQAAAARKERPATPEPLAGQPHTFEIDVHHTGAAPPFPVLSRRGVGNPPASAIEVQFRSRACPGEVLLATLRHEAERRYTLDIDLGGNVRAGFWRAAVSPDGIQLAYLEIEV